MRSSTFLIRPLLIASTAAFFFFSQAAGATNIQTFDFTWSGDSLGNSAIGYGAITLDLDISHATPTLDGVTMLDFSVRGSASLIDPNTGESTYPDGDFTLADFRGIVFDVGGNLDYTQNLVGQSDFTNFVILAQSGTFAPDALGIQSVGAAAGIGDAMVLTSLVAHPTDSGGDIGAAGAPEPASLALFGIGYAVMRAGKRRRGRNAS